MPVERVVFVLREVFNVPYGEIGLEAVRQIARRARDHVAARLRVSVSSSEQQLVMERLLNALQTGQVQALMDVLASEVVLVGADPRRQPSSATSGRRRSEPEQDCTRVAQRHPCHPDRNRRPRIGRQP